MEFDFEAAQAARAHQLIEHGRAREALALTEALASGAHHGVLIAHSTALKALNRHSEALPFDRRATELYRTSGAAWHSLAATLEDLGRHGEAKRAAERALAAGPKAPRTLLVYARALLGLREFRAAERAYRQVLTLRPGDHAASQELARALWMITGDWSAAVAPVRAARAAGGRAEALLGSVLVEANILEAAGRRDDLHALFDEAFASGPSELVLLRAAAEASLEDGDLERASGLIERALSIAPDDHSSLVALGSIRLAQGRSDEAFQAASRATSLRPLDQSGWGWAATAARATGRNDHQHLNDYERFVREYRIETPAGWSSLDAFLGELARVLREMHVFKVHPADQTLREGTQTHVSLISADAPVLKAFFNALDAPIRRYLAELGHAPDPLRSRNRGAYGFKAAWSVLLKPNGFHVSHLHPAGWISSAFYVEVPRAAVDGEGREGWIKFGEPPIKTVPAQGAEHFVKPEPGKLVLFPSYMWHGTVPFTTPESRMSIAFDLLPA